MLETIKEFISQYLPAITSVGGTIVAVVTFFANVKKILEKKSEEVKSLKEQLSNVLCLYNDLTGKYSTSQDEIVNNLTSVIKQNELLNSQVAELKELNNKLQEVAKEDATIKAQLTELLRKGE